MKRKLVFIAVIVLFLFSCATNKIVDNTFVTVLDNQSDFTIKIGNDTILPREKKPHSFPLHNSSIYDGYFFEYFIPLTENTYYSISANIFIGNSQERAIIENPSSIITPECYVVIKNESNKTLLLTDPTKTAYLAAILTGSVNNQNNTSDFNIVPNTDCVITIHNGQKELYACSITSVNQTSFIKLDTPFKEGYVYIVSVDETESHIIDCRPLLCLGQKLWKLTYNDVIHCIAQYNEHTYILATSTQKDKQGNSYGVSFLQCFNMQQEEKKWSQEFDVKGADTYLYDMLITYNGILLIAGQTIGETKNGLILQYNTEGDLLNSITVPETSGLDMITSLSESDDLFLLRGWTDNEPVYFHLTGNLTYQKASALYNTATAPIEDDSVYIKSKKNRTIFIAGELKNREMPIAAVVSVTENGYKVIYTSKEPYSFITDMVLDEEENQLIFVGTLNAKDEYGNEGTPFIRCLDLQTNKIVWEAIHTNCGFEICARIARCEDFGFILLLLNVDEDGTPSLPFKIVRTNATGRHTP